MRGEPPEKLVQSPRLSRLHSDLIRNPWRGSLFFSFPSTRYRYPHVALISQTRRNDRIVRDAEREPKIDRERVLIQTERTLPPRSSPLHAFKDKIPLSPVVDRFNLEIRIGEAN